MSGLLDPWAWRSDMNAPQPGPMPEARSYTPAWHDRVVNSITNGIFGPNANAQQREGVNHIFGPDNPFNVPAQINQGYNTAKLGVDLGDPAQAGIGVAQMAMSLPFGIGKAPAQAATKGIRAYHGSPHDFDRFSLDKIGTGEGAQAYGHGLYFAENEGVAKSYRDTLAADRAWKNQNIRDAEPVMADRLKSMGYSDDIAASVAQSSRLEHTMNTPADALKKLYASRGDEYMRAMNDAWSIKDEVFGGPTGRMYEVNIKADPNDFLDWDKPLSQQSEVVRKKLGVDPSNGDIKAADFYSALAEAAYKNTGVKGKGADQASSKALFSDLGIPGVRYLDQGSRAAGDGSRNYVVFDDSLIEILRKYGLAGILAGGAAATAQPSTAEAKGVLQ